MNMMIRARGSFKMVTQDNEQPLDDDEMEKWLENYFLDPLTSHFDQTQFRIDLYETEKEWIVEALLNDYLKSEITVLAQERKCIITAKKWSLCFKEQKKRIRLIEFPFLIINQKINAAFENGILEIFISKAEKDEIGKNRFITLT
jgi:HSP20 family molecular chaperone IbpA